MSDHIDPTKPSPLEQESENDSELDEVEATGADRNDEDAVDFAASSDTRPPAPETAHPWALGISVTALVAAAFTFAFQPERQLTFAPFAVLALTYALTAGFAIYRLRARHELSMLRPRSGDLSIAGLVGGLLYGLAYVVNVLFTAKGPRAAWVFTVYMLLGDPFTNQHHLVAVGLAIIGMLEEITWRGLILPTFEDQNGPLRGSVQTSILYAASHLPTMLLLGNEVAGPNPLLVVAALGCGLVWSYLRFRTGRLVPSILAHGLFTWAIVEFPIWRP